MIELLIASFVLSSTLLYVVWSKLRVQFLRQSLYDVRDELWDRAHENGFLDDPAYCATRDHLNNMIKLSGLYSFRTMKVVESHSGNITPTAEPQSPNPEIERHLNAAMTQSTEYVVNHILFCRASGWVVVAAAVLHAGLDHSMQGLRSKAQPLRYVLSSTAVDLLAPFQVAKDDC